MALPRRIPKPAKRASRWRSLAHCAWIRGFACCVCGSTTNVQVAHVRLGSGAGMAQKPDDWRTVPLCGGPRSNIEGQLGCHDRQHITGEATFWANKQGLYDKVDPEALIAELIKASPRKHQIQAEMKERASGQ